MENFQELNPVVIISWKFGWWHACECVQIIKKDFREAVVAARKAQHGWAAKSAYNKGQILYRIAEMLESRKAQFVSELMDQGYTSVDAQSEVSASIDRLVYYAGWSDKYQQVFSSVNRLSLLILISQYLKQQSSSYFVPENVGLIGLVSTIAPAIRKYGGCLFPQLYHYLQLPSLKWFIHLMFLRELSIFHRWAQWIVFILPTMDVNAVVYCGNESSEIQKFRSWLHWM